MSGKKMVSLKVIQKVPSWVASWVAGSVYQLHKWEPKLALTWVSRWVPTSVEESDCLLCSWEMPSGTTSGTS